MRAVRAALALLTIVVAGCGGGGGGSSVPSSNSLTPTFAPTGIPAPSATPVPVPSGASAAPAPALGYLSASGNGFSGTTSAGATTVTIAAISETPPTPRQSVAGLVPTTIQVTVKGSTGQGSAVRTAGTLGNITTGAGPRITLSAERAVDSTGLRAALSLPSRQRSAVAAATAPTAPPAARTFAVLSGGIGPTATSYSQVATSLAQTSAHSYVYVDNSLGLFSNITAGIAADFENAYLADTVHFGTASYPGNAPNGPLNYFQVPCDANGNSLSGSAPIPIVIPGDDPHVTVVVVSQANAGNGEGGYFDPANYFVQPYANCSHKISNGVPMIVLVWPSNGSPTYELGEDMVRVTAHELQHLINFVNHCILAPQCLIEDPWLDEGLSMLAQDFAVQQLNPNVPYDVDEGLSFASLYLRSPQSFDIGSFQGIDAGNSAPAFDCNGCFGGAYLLQRYLYNRFGGDTYTRSMESATATSRSNLIAVTHEDFGPLIGDFSIAMMSAQNGIAGASAFNFALNPAGTYVDQFATPLTLPGIGLAGTNAPGTTTSYGSCQGCVFYVGVTTGGAASSLNVLDLSAGSASLAAGVAQH